MGWPWVSMPWAILVRTDSWMRFSVRRYGVESVAELPSASDVGWRFTLLDATTDTVIGR